MDEIQQAIGTFIKAGDTSDTDLLNKILHKDYQNIQDGFFDETGIFVIHKEEYIRLIRDRIFGGKPRDITCHSIEQKNNIAYAQVSLESSVMKFSSLIICVQENGNWMVITNIPTIEAK
ncbi:nuclear transport factor 2 family protein [Chryseobacterium sp.]|uniref:nuclear transport factor 2 family protein n=1 Tax=Chryseobacterium sp. TaxID=1871047 RepID=UPI0025BD98B6|nr:nuclear transport factor 2 family protein [Chryseobacterium sp.]MBV8327793.1 nuclear transport factor 2 family protein [Chryseobacterium sp.]